MAESSLWLIGGSDPAGNAGIQADLRTCQDIGVNARSIITAVTAQNLTAVGCVEAVSDAVLMAQLELLAKESVPDVIKIGLLASPEQVSLLAALIAEFKVNKPVYVIFDPVMAASSGDRLQGKGVAAAIEQHLLPVVDLLMPNWDEWLQLLKLRHIEVSEADHLNSFARWYKPGDPQVYLKAGHLNGEQSRDLWFTEDEVRSFATKRLDIKARGTGCTLGSALAAYLSKRYIPEDALTLAFAYLQGALRTAQPVIEGFSQLGLPGPWPKMEYLPVVQPAPVLLMDSFESISADQLGLYPVVDSLVWIRKLINWGVKTLQLRIKGELTDSAKAEITGAIELAAEHQVRLFINDHWEFALEQGAFGIHLGQEDLEIADLNRIAAAGVRLGVSTHGFYEIAKVIGIKPSYIALGHIFPTKTKDMPSQPQGVERLSHYQQLLDGHVPTVAIGGINRDRLAEVKATGVNSIALVTAITEDDEPEKATRELLAMMGAEQ